MKTKELLEIIYPFIEKTVVLFMVYLMYLFSIFCLLYGLYSIIKAIILYEGVYFVFINSIVPTGLAMIFLFIGSVFVRIIKRLENEN